MKRFHQLISCYLALGFVFAGAVGLSPVLHQLIEHGGRGPVHTHSGREATANVLAVWHNDGDGRFHQHLLRPPSAEQVRPKKPFTEADKFELPDIPLSRALLALTRIFESGAAHPLESSPSDSAPGHQHHSLPQMLLTGLLDQCSDVPLAEFVFAPAIFLAPPADVLLLASDWDAQTLSRGPPASRS